MESRRIAVKLAVVPTFYTWKLSDRLSEVSRFSKE